MALLVYSNGMDVRVATIEDTTPVLVMDENGMLGVTEVEWEYCGDDNDYRKRCKQLEAELEALTKANAFMKQQLEQVYGALGIRGFFAKA